MDLLALSLLSPCAAALDALLGEPKRFHPLVGFGWLAARIEHRAYGGPGLSPTTRRWRGIGAVTALLLPVSVLAVAVEALPVVGGFAALAGLYLALGGHSLRLHAQAVERALSADDLTAAREAVRRIVSRDTGHLDQSAIATAAVESVLENGCDAVFGALFWFLVGGLPGVVVYRLANTLDALWGYRNDRYRDFGWAAARLDDVLNFIPARLTALAYGLCGNLRNGLRAWREQGRRWKSPNAGPVMAAGAGALDIQLGGPAVYHGIPSLRPALGHGRPAEAGDIARAVGLVQRSLGLWLGCIILGGLYFA
ncbi:adenosylcobinamide-phosphate synthase [Gammaproteobacteria bacterium]|nr:adenosylcobinamide-phosphate synthase [Gammaproteobacteria bacterium]